MFTKSKRILTLFVVSLTLLTCAGLTLAGTGKKPPKDDGGDGVASGQIYFLSGGPAWVMNADGSEKTLSVAGEPSRDVHSGYRWFLQIQPTAGTFPNGDARQEIFAVREDGVTSVQLTTDSNVKPILTHEHPRVEWATDSGTLDGKISFTGLRFDDNGNIIESGIFTALIVWDSGPSAASESLVWSVSLFEAAPGRFEPDTFSHAWSPNGTMLVHDARSAYDLQLVDLTYNTSSFLAEGIDVDWSPDGSLIAFESSDFGDLHVIDLDGGTETKLVDGGSKGRRFTLAGSPSFSPDSKFVAYERLKSGNADPTIDVFVIGVDGSGNSNLTSDTSDFSIPTAWR